MVISPSAFRPVPNGQTSDMVILSAHAEGVLTVAFSHV
jgi:hypothetical protein